MVCEKKIINFKALRRHIRCLEAFYKIIRLTFCLGFVTLHTWGVTEEARFVILSV